MDLITETLEEIATAYRMNADEVMDLYLRAARKVASKRGLEVSYNSRTRQVAFVTSSGRRTGDHALMAPLINVVREMLRQTANERASGWEPGVHPVRVVRDERSHVTVESLDGERYGTIPEKLRGDVPTSPGTVVLALAGKHGERVLSLTDNEILAFAVEREVPEVAEGTVRIRGIARIPGVRSKVAVSSNDPSVNAVGACIGHMAARISEIRHAMGGERVEVIAFHEDLAEYIAAAIVPAEGCSVHVIGRTASVYVDAVDMTRAIGQHGQNVKLVAMLMGRRINIHPRIEVSGDAEAVGAVR